MKDNKRNIGTVDLSQYTFGKLPPQANDLEEAVLGAMLLEAHAVNVVIEILTPPCFYLPQHQKIYQAIMNLFGQNKPIDILTVAEELKKMGALEDAGGVYYISTLTNNVASSANAEHHARIIQQKYLGRKLIEISSIVIRDSYEDTIDVLELFDNSISEMIALRSSLTKGQLIHISKVTLETRKKINALSSGKIEILGIKSNIKAIDDELCGFEPGAVYTIAGRPGMGKSGLITSIIDSMNCSIGFFSLEMPATQQELRIKSRRSQIPLMRLRHGNIYQNEWEQLDNAESHICNSKIYIDDTPSLNIIELRSRAMQMKHKYGIEILFVDYLQLITGVGEKGKSQNREQEISQISRTMKQIAKELNIPVVNLAQLSRAVEQRGGDKKPQLSDLRESGSIEQDSDVVIFIYRPEYYGLPSDSDGNSTVGTAELIVAKNRNGNIGTIKVKFKPELVSFEDEFKQEMKPIKNYYEPTSEDF